MKQYQMNTARAMEHKPEHPERTARRDCGAPISSIYWGDVIFQVWPNRASMLKTIELQDQRPSKFTNWTACK